MLASAGGFAAVYVVAGALAVLAGTVWPRDASSADDVIVPLAALASIPFFQWLLLRRRVPRSWSWFVATDAGLIAGVALASLVSRANPGLAPALGLVSFLSGWVGLTLTGLCLGVAQWAVLRRHIRLPGLWVAASVVGWAGTIAVVVPGRPGSPLVWTAMGAMTGLWTGLALALLWWDPPEEATAAAG